MATEDLRIKAAKVAAAASLKDLRLQASHTELIEFPTPGVELSVDLKVDLKANKSPNKDLVALAAQFTVNISEARDEKKQGIAIISCAFSSAFEMAEQVDWSDDELEAFANTTGIFAVHPYAREFVSDATSRMGLPTLTLDFLKL